VRSKLEEGRAFYRYMSRSEAEAVLRTGMLRGGRPGRTYWTEDRYETTGEAKRRLALAALPEVRMRFTIRNDPHLRRAGDTVESSDDEPGGGTEWMTLEAVEVEVIAVDNLE
jgi:hypothetical protein